MFGGHGRQNAWIELERDVDGITIPNGDQVMLQKGEKVVVQQELGDTFTLRTMRGYLIRIDGEDADAIGREVPETAGRSRDGPDADQPLEERVFTELRKCYDPEIPINIVELGLIYDVDITENDDGTHDVQVDMTLTAPGCGMGDILAQDVKQKVQRLDGVDACDVQIVFDPPWTPDKLSDEARLELGLI